ncbi:hypothetical protein BH09VER1_BH09VER1_48600 [soil metagenome]
MPATSRQKAKPKAKSSTPPPPAKAPATPRPWFVYLLRCANGALYTGIATDVLQRLATHNAGQGSAYVRAHRPATLLAFTPAENRSAASKLEHQVKFLTQPQKLALAKKWQAAAHRHMKAIDSASDFS